MTAVPIYVFGEVLFDCFPDGTQILGGAPFNVAWHLQAFGDQPHFISRIGADQPGDKIRQAMKYWRMDSENLQTDTIHPTGRVEVSFTENEPSYQIVPDCAYDFISADELKVPCPPGILYHGSLCLRNSVSAEAFSVISRQPGMKIFLDVNLRPPWWRMQQLEQLLQAAQWVKMNQHELQQLSSVKDDLAAQMAEVQNRFELEQLILTRGEQGALVRTRSGKVISVEPVKAGEMIDTVGAGDAFSSFYLHGLRNGLEIVRTLQLAQRFASGIIGLRGATTTEHEFYRRFIRNLDD